MMHEHAHRPLRFTRKVWTAYALFLLYSLVWFGLGRVFHVPARDTAFWLAAATMLSAHIYYVLEAFDSSGGRRALDLTLNITQGAAATTLILARLGGAVSMRTALVLVAAISFAHPVVTDTPHIRRWLRTRISDYVPPACIAIDVSLGIYALVAFLVG